MDNLAAFSSPYIVFVMPALIYYILVPLCLMLAITVGVLQVVRLPRARWVMAIAAAVNVILVIIVRDVEYLRYVYGLLLAPMQVYLWVKYSEGLNRKSGNKWVAPAFKVLRVGIMAGGVVSVLAFVLFVVLVAVGS